MARQRAAKSKKIGRKPNFRPAKISTKRALPENDVDEFFAKRDYIKLQGQQSDSDEFDDVAPLDDEILALEISESDSEEDAVQEEDHQEEDEEEDYIEEAESAPKQQRREMKIKLEDAIATAWGKKKNIFYGSEAADFEIDSESENEAREEEEEAIRQQTRILSNMDETDFGADDLAAFLESDCATQAQAKSQIETKIMPNVAALSTEEKMRHIAKDSPELLGLLQELDKAVVEIKAKIVGQNSEQLIEGASPDGIALLSVQHHLLLHYCVALVFYLMMKAEGRSVRRHPVIDRLITIRALLERILPIRAKIAYMVDKIVRQQPMLSDPLRHKPSVDEMPGSDADSFASREGGDHDQEPASKIYVPTKNRMVPYEEKDTKQKKQEERRLKKLHESEFMQSLRDEFSSAPEQLATHDDNDRESDDERERRQFEEQNFLRLSDSKRRKKSMSSIAGEFDDFENITGLLRQQDSDNSDDELQALRKAKARAKSSISDERVQAAISSAMVSDVDDEDFDFYSAAKKKAEKATKQKQQIQTSRKQQQSVKYANDVADGRRAASKKIVENRGIKRYRSKDAKNPRVKHRRKFEKAMVKRKTIVKEFSQKHSTTYGGEATGIKPHLSRSTSLK